MQQESGLPFGKGRERIYSFHSPKQCRYKDVFIISVALKDVGKKMDTMLGVHRFSCSLLVSAELLSRQWEMLIHFSS